eukprot:CAMPEP_0185844194 /NCGR_PEP_ID=MMETSP1354-20130828/446_1 /TAXON_ID=708628 /ORGANISM="Erythrolobus madagascarensis, Strain CCMP3276" /LENGTH=430 /DNA_ID=CAMNT_0028543815 /DNA_START=36 /DNA_END=1328 /DNA_ORIENTATION=+
MASERSAAVVSGQEAVALGVGLQFELIPLVVCAQNYAWGKVGAASLVANVFAQNASAEIDASAPYAELWIGDHPKGEACTLSPEKVRLSELLAKCAWELPYLFKILSVQSALSIQAHPDKALAAKLHASDPKNYPDANHKPEMSVALSPFRAMCGFRALDLIAHDLHSCSELADLVGSDVCDSLIRAGSAPESEIPASSKKSALRELFSTLMLQSNEKVEVALSALQSRLSAKESGSLLPQEELFLSLYSQYPGDVGCFAAFLLNYVLLEPGQAFYMAANEPHAYLSGECVEIMARSDNVVRAGLTPKFKDVETLLNMLTYESGPVTRVEQEKMTPFVSRYVPPASEFQLTSVDLPAKSSAVLERAGGVGMLLTIRGSGSVSAAGSSMASNKRWQLGVGAILLIPPGLTLTISSSDSDLLVFVSGVNSSV